jgi:hypothetical protein
MSVNGLVWYRFPSHFMFSKHPLEVQALRTIAYVQKMSTVNICLRRPFVLYDAQGRKFRKLPIMALVRKITKVEPNHIPKEVWVQYFRSTL